MQIHSADSQRLWTSGQSCILDILYGLFILINDPTLVRTFTVHCLCECTELMCVYLENDVSLMQVSILGSQACAAHLFDEDLTPQA